MPKHYRPPGKKKEGSTAKYITRKKAIRHLQVTLPVFRKICILKGIFPREPKKKFEGNHKTYYDVKDISIIQHDPLIQILRENKIYIDKIKKAVAKKNNLRAELLMSRKPSYNLDRVIKERLSHEWQAYVCRTNRLRKSFICVKGIYYQVEVQGQKISWLTPHALQQVITDDVDFKVMLTFLEFYETLLAFINCRLYHSINVNYPPTLDPRLEAIGAGQYALSKYIAANSRASLLESQVGKEATQTEEYELRLAQLQHQLPANEPGALMQLVEGTTAEDKEDDETRECKMLFKDLKIFLSREVPRESFCFVIPAFGGAVSWEGKGSPFKETDDGITHQIVDRPTQGHVFLSREYVQPQWIYDCVNARVVLPTDGYLVGRVPPPHLSPFVDNKGEGYVPEYAETIEHLKAAANKEVLPMPGFKIENLHDPQRLLAEGIISRTEDIKTAERKLKMDLLEMRYHTELKSELERVPYPTASPAKYVDSIDEKMKINRRAAEQSTMDALVMDEIMQSRKQRELGKAIKIGQEKKKAYVALLKERKKNASKST